MDEGTFFLQLFSSVDPIAVAFAITTTAVLKYLLCRPPDPGTIDPPPSPAWKALVERAIPLLPIFFATLYVIVKGYIEMRYGIVQTKMAPEKVLGWSAIAGRGVVSGAMAGYLYRAWKVTIQGK